MLSAGLFLVALSGVPDIDRPVVDLANAIEPDDEEAIARRLVLHREATGVQLAVLIVSSTDPLEIFDYSQQVFDHWGGGSAERDDGALFVLAIDDRQNRLHLGYGLEPVIPDILARAMLDDLRPALQRGAYAEATTRLVDAVVDRTAHLRPGEPVISPRGDSHVLWIVVGTLALVLGFAWGWALRRASAQRAPDRRSSSRWRKLASDRVGRAVMVAIVASAAAFALVFGDAMGYRLAYAFAAGLYFGLGWLARAIHRDVGWTLAASTAVTLGVLYWRALGETGLVLGSDIAGLAFGAFYCVLIGGGMLGLCIWAYRLTSHAGRQSGSNAHSSSNGGGGESAYASSSAVASHSSAASSYTETPYSGGGGSSGGGGASSSW
jgi:uncharacterized protein